MSTVQEEAQPSCSTLLEAAAQLSAPELDQLLDGVLTLRARRRAPNLSSAESTLLLIINEPLPTAVQERFDELRSKLPERTLTPDEHRELLELTDQKEMHWARRIEAAAELALLRGVPLPSLLQQLGIPTAQGERQVV
ncbi:MAG: STAS/SEC14 domain-containing protein [Armatimonadota bacterium]|nr:STAS/SEC14 domain-containing protein [Armatimonadota bacterium]